MSTTNTAAKLVKGQRIRLPDLTGSGTMSFNLSLTGLNQVGFYCLVLDATEKLLRPDYVIYAGQPRSPCQSISIERQDATSVSFALNLANLPPEARELMVVVSMGEHTGCLRENAADIQEGFLSITDGKHEQARYTFTAQDFEGEKALILCKVYFKDVWRMALVSSGFRAGMRVLLQNYGVPAHVLEEGREEPHRDASPPVAPPSEGPRPAIERGTLRVFLPSHWPGHQVPPLPQGIIPGVGFILVKYEDGNHASGTGFVINPGGYVLSCYHVIQNASDVRICLGDSRLLRPLVFVAGDAEHDACLLWIADGNGSPYWLSLVGPDETPQLGEALGLLAFPLSLELGLGVNYSQGIINSCRQRGDVPLLQIDAGAAPGSSGGPVFRRSDGRIVGMLQGGVERHGMLINLAWDIRAFWKMGWHVTET
ncbi:MAG: hypothetical protein HC884_09195 [Chloroflexaceae bacterium]|nr:hypothetical protein [Chloroflexaceae bacterium]